MEVEQVLPLGPPEEEELEVWSLAHSLPLLVQHTPSLWEQAVQVVPQDLERQELVEAVVVMDSIVLSQVLL